MTSTHLALAAQNNALWCDAVCRAHGLPGEFHDAFWLARGGTPRFYPDVVTTADADGAPAQTEAIADLVQSDRQREWFVKDSFHCLRLQALGFRPLFDAEWIAMSGASSDVAHHKLVHRPEVVSDEAGLIAWERSWTSADSAVSDPLPRIFKARLLEDDNIRFISMMCDDALVGGGILHRGANVVGLSNLFGYQLDQVWRDLIVLSRKTFPDLPLVGYEHGDDLTLAKAAGFEAIGPLRIWRLPEVP